MKLADFGLTYGDPSAEFIPFAPGGTPMYESPEKLTGKNITTKGDIWALGLVAYELCELKHMFRENTRDGVKEAIEKNDIPQIGGIYSDRLKVVIDLMLQKNPSDRINLPELRSHLLQGVINSMAYSDPTPSPSYSSSTFQTVPVEHFSPTRIPLNSHLLPCNSRTSIFNSANSQPVFTTDRVTSEDSQTVSKDSPIERQGTMEMDTEPPTAASADLSIEGMVEEGGITTTNLSRQDDSHHSIFMPSQFNELATSPLDNVVRVMKRKEEVKKKKNF